MTTKVKSHKRKGKNKVSIVKEYTRKGGCGSKKSMKKGSGEELKKKKSCASCK